MKDGVRLYTYGMRPDDGGKHPTIIRRTPYVNREKTDLDKFEKKNEDGKKRGYAIISQHCRGCGMSEGEWIPYEDERSDGLALLEWARKLPWYNGELFLDGGSYLAAVHWSYLDTNLHGNVKGLQSEVREPKIAHNAIDAAASEIGV